MKLRMRRKEERLGLDNERDEEHDDDELENDDDPLSSS